MTQEDKEILLKDLCARLPYYPKCEMIDELRVVNNEKDPSYISTLFPKHIELFSYHNNFTIKPYLHPMSSMTEEEEVELGKLIGKASYNMMRNVDFHDLRLLLEFIYKKHLDYNHLIEKDLALEANKDMYK